MKPALAFLSKLFRPINPDELVKETKKEPVLEVTLYRDIDGTIEEDALPPDGEIKIDGTGKVYVKRSGRWQYDETIVNIEIFQCD